MKKKFRGFFLLLLAADLFVLGIALVRYMDASVPDRLFAFVGEKADIKLPFWCRTEESREVLKVTNEEDGFSLVSGESGSYEVPVKLFGVIPMKQVNIRVIQRMEVAPSGEPIGIYVATNGLLVLDTAEIEGKDGLTYAPAGNILKSGDYILKWNGVPVPTIQQLNREIQKTGNHKSSVTVRRGREQIQLAVRPIRATDGSYKIGTWVREDTQGIGTLTYITKDGKFGTLGHGITDADTGTLLNLQGGELYRTKILGVTKGVSGEPGELQGYINMVAANEIGEIQKNTRMGVFGKLKKDFLDDDGMEYMNIGVRQEIREGKAEIYTSLGGTSGKFQVEIESVDMNSRDNKGMVIHITDQRLLKLTGGIVQGMSGSPIVQNGKLVGAVTHVFVDDPTRGYGVFIESMLGEEMG